MAGWEKNFRNPSVNVHQFAMVPRAEIPRSSFDRQYTHKTTFDPAYLVPVYVDEVLPGDTFSLSMTGFCRLATPLYPTMDNLVMDSFFFFVPNRLLWSHWKNFMGEQANPGDSISYTIPQQVSPAGGYAAFSLQDYMGLPTAGSPFPGGNTFSHSALHLRAYNLIYNEWFRDENLQNSVTVDTGDGPDNVANYVILSRGKRKDYFTSALPWPQKGNTAVSIPLGTSARVIGDGNTATGSPRLTSALTGTRNIVADGPGVTSTSLNISGAVVTGPSASMAFANVDQGAYADLSNATAATINQLRQSFQIQKLLERDARGGTRYTEIIRAHFGVVSPDARLQRPEYLGGGSSPIVIAPVAQTSGTSASGTTTPLGQLAGAGTAMHRAGFTQSFTEHGVLIGLVSVRADMTYQQGLRRMWSRSTRYDFYFPAFAMLGEQSILNKEIYCDGSANDTAVFGYQERWAEYRYLPSQITGAFRSTYATPLDAWHYANKFSSLPALNAAFIVEQPAVGRTLAVNVAGERFYADFFFNVRSVRPMPMYSVPGLIDHF